MLTENKLIGLSWAVIDYDDVNSNKRKFWNLSHKQTFFGNASDLVAFRLMPLEPQFRKPIDALWSFKVLDMERRSIAFHDDSQGEVSSWRWDFGDGTQSIEQNPIHQIPADAGPGEELHRGAVRQGSGGRVTPRQGVGRAHQESGLAPVRRVLGPVLEFLVTVRVRGSVLPDR